MIRIQGISTVAARQRAERRQNTDFGRERPAGVMRLHLAARRPASLGESPRVVARVLQRSAVGR